MNRLHSLALACTLTAALTPALGQLSTVEVPLFFGNLSVPGFGPVDAGNFTGSLMVGVRGLGFDRPFEESLRSFNSYFVFDLSGVTFGPVVSATLEVRHGQWGHFSDLSTEGLTGVGETVGLYDISTDSAFLRNPSQDFTAYMDLQSGVSFGTTLLSKPGDPNLMAGLTLNAEGIQAVQSALGSGEFRVGATLLSTIENSGQIEGDFVFLPGWQNEQLLKNSVRDVQLRMADADGNQLLVRAVIPEPNPLWAGLLLFGATALHRHRRTAPDRNQSRNTSPPAHG